MQKNILHYLYHVKFRKYINMKLNTIFSYFTPKERKFYPILSDISANTLACSELLIELTKTSDKEARKDVYRQIKKLETKGDSIVDTLFNELNSTFITPFDREDIHALGEKMDDVLDSINSIGKRVIMYQPKQLPEQSAELALLLKKSCELMHSAIEQLPNVKKGSKSVKDICIQMHAIENQADDLYANFITDIFEKEENAIELIKIKEIIHELERATDDTDTVGKIIKSMIVKYA